MVFYIRDRQIVIPGQLLAENERFGEGCFLENSKIYSNLYGLARIKNGVEVIPLNGIYVPKVGDVVIGIVKEIHQQKIHVNINSPYEGIIMIENNYYNFNRKEEYKTGEVISGIVIDVNEIKQATLSKIFKISPEYHLIYMNPKRVPRVIGKKKSMLNILKERTNCKMIVGQNGIIAISGKSIDDVEKARLLIKYIEENAYKEGLTEKISNMPLPEKK